MDTVQSEAFKIQQRYMLERPAEFDQIMNCLGYFKGREGLDYNELVKLRSYYFGLMLPRDEQFLKAICAKFSSVQGLVGLDEKEARKVGYRVVADGFWEGKIKSELPINNIIDLAPIIAYTVKAICQRFGIPKVPTVDEINREVEDCLSTDAIASLLGIENGDGIEKASKIVGQAIHAMLGGRP